MGSRILHKNIDQLPPKNVKLIPYSKSSDTVISDKPPLNDAPSIESDQQSNKASEFKQWSSQQKIRSLRKAKSQNTLNLNEYPSINEGQYIPTSKARQAS